MLCVEKKKRRLNKKNYDIDAKPKAAYTRFAANTLNVNRFCNAQIHKHNKRNDIIHLIFYVNA